MIIICWNYHYWCIKVWRYDQRWNITKCIYSTPALKYNLEVYIALHIHTGDLVEQSMVTGDWWASPRDQYSLILIYNQTSQYICRVYCKILIWICKIVTKFVVQKMEILFTCYHSIVQKIEELCLSRSGSSEKKLIQYLYFPLNSCCTHTLTISRCHTIMQWCHCVEERCTYTTCGVFT